jgi:hypothetical protein
LKKDLLEEETIGDLKTTNSDELEQYSNSSGDLLINDFLSKIS